MRPLLRGTAGAARREPCRVTPIGPGPAPGGRLRHGLLRPCRFRSRAVRPAGRSGTGTSGGSALGAADAGQAWPGMDKPWFEVTDGSSRTERPSVSGPRAVHACPGGSRVTVARAVLVGAGGHAVVSLPPRDRLGHVAGVVCGRVPGRRARGAVRRPLWCGRGTRCRGRRRRGTCGSVRSGRARDRCRGRCRSADICGVAARFSWFFCFPFGCASSMAHGACRRVGDGLQAAWPVGGPRGGARAGGRVACCSYGGDESSTRDPGDRR
jgi:hypothetical protein